MTKHRLLREHKRLGEIVRQRDEAINARGAQASAADVTTSEGPGSIPGAGSTITHEARMRIEREITRTLSMSHPDAPITIRADFLAATFAELAEARAARAAYASLPPHVAAPRGGVRVEPGCVCGDFCSFRCDHCVRGAE